MSQKIIYLDQYVWINLARIYYGFENNPDISKVFETILKKSDSNELIFPLSAVHLIETQHIQEKERRERLIDFMLKVSKGYTIIPFNNISGMLGAEPDIEFSGSLDKEQLKQIKQEVEWINSPDALSWIFKRQEIFNQINEKDYSYLINEIEKIRSEYKNVIDKKLRYKLNLVKNFYGIVFPIVGNICKEIGLSKESIFLETWNEEDWMNFMKEIPSFYVLFNLSYGSEKDFSKPIKKNDLNDVYLLTISIPYCDIVVCDKTFAHYVEKANLDKIYPTIILPSIGELEHYI